jgi:hypothetical protein
MEALSTTLPSPSARLDSSSPDQVWVEGGCLEGRSSAVVISFPSDDTKSGVLRLDAPHTAARADLQGLLRCLQQGFSEGDILCPSAFISRAYAGGWPATYRHQDIMEQIKKLWSPSLRVVKVRPRADLRASLRLALVSGGGRPAACSGGIRRDPCSLLAPEASVFDSQFSDVS